MAAVDEVFAWQIAQEFVAPRRAFILVVSLVVAFAVMDDVVVVLLQCHVASGVGGKTVVEKVGSEDVVLLMMQVGQSMLVEEAAG